MFLQLGPPKLSAPGPEILESLNKASKTRVSVENVTVTAMIAVQPTVDEVRRVAALRQYAVLDTPPEQTLDDLTVLAGQICRAPIALISLVDENRPVSYTHLDVYKRQESVPPELPIAPIISPCSISGMPPREAMIPSNASR